MGVTMEYSHPLTPQVLEHVEFPIGKTNTLRREEFPLVPIRNIATLVLLSTFVDMI